MQLVAGVRVPLLAFPPRAMYFILFKDIAVGREVIRRIEHVADTLSLFGGGYGYRRGNNALAGGGGLVGLVLLILIVLFLMGRL